MAVRSAQTPGQGRVDTQRFFFPREQPRPTTNGAAEQRGRITGSRRPEGPGGDLFELLGSVRNETVRS